MPGTVVNGDNLVVRGQSSASYSTTTSATLTIGGASGRSATFYIRTRPNPGSSAVIPQTRLGDSHSYVLNDKGTAFGFGYNGNGQLGNGTTLGTSLPTPVAGLGGLRDIASGANHGLALRDDRTVVAWGYNAAGQLGSGSTENSIKNFVAVSGLSNIVAIAAGDYHSLTLKQDGTVWAWGLNVDGQLGDGSTVTLRNVPVQVTGLSGVVAITAGGRHSLAVKIDGSVVAWGSNSNGQLGNGSIISSNVPIAVLGLSNIATVAAGGLHSLAVKDDATVAAWGSNAFGQLGVGDTTNRLMPVLVPGLTQIGRIAAGAAHSLALKAGGTFYSWGNNANNQLGDASTTNKSSPYLVPGITNVVAIGGGGRHSAAVRADGKVSLFGDNFFGQLGNKSGNYSPHSSALNVLRGDSQISGFGGSATSSAGSTSSSGSAIIDINPPLEWIVNGSTAMPRFLTRVRKPSR